MAVTNLGSSQEDSQPYWNIYHHSITKGENGYYMMIKIPLNEGTGFHTMYVDSETGESTYLCGKPECNHNNQECNAYMSDTYGQDIYYHNGYVYAYELDEEDGYVYLIRINADGSGREKLFEIGVGDGEWGAYNLIFRENNVYIYMRQGSTTGLDEVTSGIRRRSLDGKEDEYIYQYKGIGATVYGLKSYGDKLFFMVEEFTRNKDNHGDMKYDRKGLFTYDYNTKEVKQFSDKSICDYTIDTKNNDIYYYIVSNGLYRRNLLSGEEKKLYDYEKNQTEICQLSYDGTYIYMNNELFYTFFYEPPKSGYLTYVCDKEGNILNTITSKGPFTTYFGDDKYIFSKEQAFGRGKMRYIKKSDILTATEWTTID